MAKIKFTYDSKKVITDIDFSNKREDSKLQIARGIKLDDWIHELPIRLANEVGDDCEILFSGTDEDFSKIKDVLENYPGSYKFTCRKVTSRVLTPGNRFIKNERHINNTVPQKTKTTPFELLVENVMEINIQSAAVSGKIKQGSVRTGEKVIINSGGKEKTAIVAGVEISGNQYNYGQAPDNVILLLRNVGAADVTVGDLITKGDENE